MTNHPDRDREADAAFDWIFASGFEFLGKSFSLFPPRRPLPMPAPSQPQLPPSCADHQPKFKPNVWRDYTVAELGAWVGLFLKRATHRTQQQDAARDLDNAQNYFDMIQAHINATAENVFAVPETLPAVAGEDPLDVTAVFDDEPTTPDQVSPS